MALAKLICVGSADSTDMQCITFALTVSLDVKELPFSIIDGGQTFQQILKIAFIGRLLYEF